MKVIILYIREYERAETTATGVSSHVGRKKLRQEEEEEEEDYGHEFGLEGKVT